MGRKKLSVHENNQRMICAQLAVDANEQGLSDLGGAFQYKEVESEMNLQGLFCHLALVIMPQCLCFKHGVVPSKFSTFLMLLSFDTFTHVVVTTNHKIIFAATS